MKWMADEIQHQLLWSKARKEKIPKFTKTLANFQLDISIQERDFGIMTLKISVIIEWQIENLNYILEQAR